MRSFITAIGGLVIVGVVFIFGAGLPVLAQLAITLSSIALWGVVCEEFES